MTKRRREIPKSSLSIEKAPVTKPTHQPKKLGLIKKEKTATITFRFRLETIDGLEELTTKVNGKTNIKISKTQILDLLIFDALKQPEKIIKLIENN